MKKIFHYKNIDIYKTGFIPCPGLWTSINIYYGRISTWQGKHYSTKRLYEAKWGGTPNEWSPSSEIYVKCQSKTNAQMQIEF